MLGKKLRTEDDRIKAAAKARKKKRKKMIKTKYGQKAVRHSKRGVYSCTYAVVIAFLVIVMILFSFMNKGNVNILMGFFKKSLIYSRLWRWKISSLAAHETSCIGLKTIVLFQLLLIRKSKIKMVNRFRWH